MADSNVAGQEAFKQASNALDSTAINEANKVIQQPEAPKVEEQPTEEDNFPTGGMSKIQDDAQSIEDDFPTGGFSSVYSFVQKHDMLAKTGNISYPKYRTLSEQQSTSYVKAKDLPEYQRKAMLVDLAKSQEQDALKNAKNAAIVYAMDTLSGARTELALGNMLMTEDYTPLLEFGAEIAGAEIGATVAKEAGKGALAKTALGVVGATSAGAIVSALSPTPAGETMTQELEQLRSLGVVPAKPSEEQAKENAYNILKAQGLSDEEIKKITEPSGVQTFGLKLAQSALDKLEYKASIAPQVDNDSVGATLTQGALSMGEYLAIGYGAKILSSAATRNLIKRDITPTTATRFKNITGKEIQPTRLKEVPTEVKERYTEIVGAKAGSIASTTNMSIDVMGGGALESVQKYIEETGDTELQNYKGDLHQIGIDAFNTHIQNIIEQKLGLGKFIKNPRLATKWGEWLNGFIQEFTQGEVNDISEYIKGNQTLMDVLNNIPQNAIEGAVGGLYQGAIGTATYQYHHNQNVDSLTQVIMSQSTKEKPIDEKKAREFANKKISEIEEGITKNVAKEIIDFTDMSQYQGKIYENIKSNITKAISDQRQAMKDTLEGSKFDDMTEEELAQYIESVAQDETDKTVIESLENGTPLSESPRLKGITIDGTYYIEGSDYAKETERQAQERRAAIRQAVLDQRQAISDAKLANRIAEGRIKAMEKRQKEESERQTREAKQREIMQQRLEKELERTAKQREKQELTIAKQDAQQVKSEKSETVANIKGGSVDIIRDVLSTEGFRTRDLSGTAIKELAKMNWTLFKGKDLGMSARRGEIQTKLASIDRNVESGNDVLLRAGLTQEQIDKMDDSTWNNAVIEAYKKETEELQVSKETEYTEEELEAIGDLEYQEQFDLADENARLDEIYPEYKGETINIDGKERSVYNSNGERIAKSEQALRNFYKWFGDSKVVDEQGRPLVVYHGTDAEFDTFDMSKGRSTMDIQGAFFSPWELDSKGYGSNVRAFYIKLEKPANEGVAYKELNKHKGQTGAGTMARESLVSMGYDGVNNSGEEYIVFKPENIKSVDNRGTYSSDTGNIYFQSRQSGKGGAYDARTRSITLGAKADATTFPHEFAHYWIDKNFKWARSGRASQEWKRQWDAVEKWLGIDPDDKYLDKAASEKFARAYERFLAENELPLVLQKSVADFRDLC